MCVDFGVVLVFVFGVVDGGYVICEDVVESGIF